MFCHVDIHTEGGKAGIRVVLGVGVNRHMAFIQVGHYRVSLHRDHGALRHQNGHTGPLRLIILLGNIQNLGPDHLRHMSEDFCQAVRIVLLVDIGNIILLFPLGFRVAYVIYIEAQGFAYGDTFEENKYTEGSYAENELAILQERDKEFVSEGKRWFDVLRMQYGCCIQVSKCSSGRRVCQVISRYIHSLYRGDRTILGRSDTFLHLSHFRSQCRLVPHG